MALGGRDVSYDRGTPVFTGGGTWQMMGLEKSMKEMCSGSEAGSYLRLIDSCITQLKAQEPSRTCNERKEEERPGR